MIDEIITCLISIFFELFEVQLGTTQSSPQEEQSKMKRLMLSLLSILPSTLAIRVTNPQTSFKSPTNSHPPSTAINAVESSVSSGVHM
jgi:hypothetical protein